MSYKHTKNTFLADHKHQYHGSLTTANLALLGDVEEGDLAYDTTLNIPVIHNGTRWRAIGTPILNMSTANTATATTAAVDVNGTSVTVPDGWFTTNRCLHFVLAGTRTTGTNGALTITLYVDNGDILTLTVPANTSVDFAAEIWLIAVTSTTQKLHGILTQETEDNHTIDATDTTDFDDGATTTVKVRIADAHTDDATVVSFAYVELIEI